MEASGISPGFCTPDNTLYENIFYFKLRTIASLTYVVSYLIRDFVKE